VAIVEYTIETVHKGNIKRLCLGFEFGVLMPQPSNSSGRLNRIFFLFPTKNVQSRKPGRRIGTYYQHPAAQHFF
jgi:hypothetical protein